MATGVGIINHNISAINSLRTLQGTNNKMSENLKKLSSGLRINTAADDAAGLAVSEKMRGQISGLQQATRNAQDGISMIQTAEGVLDSVHNILQRMRLLAVQAANDSYTSYDRRRIQEEMDLLIDEVDRIADYTEFNRKKLMNGTTIGHANPADKRVLTADVHDIVVDADYSITVLKAGSACNIHGNANLFDGADADNIPNLRDIGVTGTQELHVVINQNTHVIDLHEEDTLQDVIYKINTSGAPVKAGLDQEGNDLTLTSMHSGPKFNISFGDDPDGLAMRLGLFGGVNGTMTSQMVANDATGNPLPHALFTTGTHTIISITNITQQAQFPTNPGLISVPGGYGRSLGVFVSESRVFSDKELARPINSLTVTNLYSPRPAWNDIDGDGVGDPVDLTNSGLLKGFSIHIDAELDYGLLQQTNDDDLANEYSLLGIGGPYPGPDFTAYWPGAYGQDIDGDGVIDFGDPFARNQTDHFAATPNGHIWGTGNTSSLYTTRLSIRDTRQVFHIGANEGQVMITDFGNMSSESLGLSWSYRAEGVKHDGTTKLLSGSRTQNLRQYLSVQTQDDAEHAISIIDEAMDVVSKKRSQLGAFQSSLEKNIYYLSIAEENLQASESRIRDVDMAKEMTEFTKNQVLMQSGTAMLAQANQKPQSILQLLG